MKNIKKSFAVLAAAALVIFAVLFLAGLVSCVPEQSNEAPRIAATQINIFEVGASGTPVTITALEGLNVGDTKTLLVEVQPANAADKAVTWKSSNDSIVVIDATGKLTAKASGNATITATASSGAAATLSVSVAYSVTTEAQLQAIAQNLAGYYVLKNDIPLTQQWTPLGVFTGTLDGAGYSVENLWIDEPRINNNNGMGFISENRGTIKNIGVELDSRGVKGGDFFGALVGINRGVVSGRVTGTGKVSGRGSMTGGLVGLNYGTVIGYATVAVEAEGSSGTGGLVGQSSGRVVGYATGAVSGATGVGGLVGISNSGATVIGYATGAVTGTRSDPQQNVNQIGGLIGDFLGSIYGYARGGVSIDRTFTTIPTNIGPAVGYGDAASAANIYYSGKSGESGFTYTGSSGTVTSNTLGTKVTVTTSTAQSAFPNLTFGSDVGEWTFYTGKWPAINFPADQSIFDDVRGDKQPIAP